MKSDTIFPGFALNVRTFGHVASDPISRVKTQLHGQVTHQLNSLSRRGCALQGNLLKCVRKTS